MSLGSHTCGGPWDKAHSRPLVDPFARGAARPSARTQRAQSQRDPKRPHTKACRESTHLCSHKRQVGLRGMWATRRRTSYLKRVSSDFGQALGGCAPGDRRYQRVRPRQKVVRAKKELILILLAVGAGMLLETGVAEAVIWPLDAERVGGRVGRRVGRPGADVLLALHLEDALFALGRDSTDEARRLAGICLGLA